MSLWRNLTLLCGLTAWLIVPQCAFAYESEVTSVPVGLSCTVCHGVSGLASGTVDASRKGPHGGYTTGTAKCETCHFTHSSPISVYLLPEQTIKATCLLCHDGIGGNGVYGTIRARTGFEPPATHRIDATRTVPACATEGDTEMEFTGVDYCLTCSDCHSPHDINTVAPFIGDRVRTAGDVPTQTASNRLLRNNPGNTTSTVAAYGSDWCGACHRGALNAHQSPGLMGAHSVASDTVGVSYSNIVRLTGTDTTATEIGQLGGSNFGYLMPYPRSASQAGKGPICQQCHEDARHVGDDPAEPYVLQPGEVFSITAPDGVEASDTPRFQVFPHEGQNVGFRLEDGDDLCLNCHPA